MWFMIGSMAFTVVCTWINGASNGYREGMKAGLIEGRKKTLDENYLSGELVGYAKGMEQGKKLADKRYG